MPRLQRNRRIKVNDYAYLAIALVVVLALEGLWLWAVGFFKRPEKSEPEPADLTVPPGYRVQVRPSPHHVRRWEWRAYEGQGRGPFDSSAYLDDGRLPRTRTQATAIAAARCRYRAAFLERISVEWETTAGGDSR